MNKSELQACRAAARALRQSTTEKRNAVIGTVRDLILERQGEILAANAADLAALSADTPGAFRDRLLLSPNRLKAVRDGLDQVIALNDGFDGEVSRHVSPDGLLVRRVRAPLGVLLTIFESRPNVAVEIFAAAFKAGNVAILRGGKESQKTLAVFFAIFRAGLEKHGLSPQSFYGITDSDRTIIQRLLQEKDFIDVVVPRGGDQLIEFVTKHATMPVLKNDRGLCHVYVDQDADLAMATKIVVNAKTQRPGVCNAMETLLVHEHIAPRFLPALFQEMAPQSVEWLACGRTQKILGNSGAVSPATEESWNTEHLALRMNCRVVKGLEEALSHIEKHGSKHSEAIVTGNEATARRFQNEVDAAVTYWNASTRYTDGFEFGLGSEIGISTQKLHVRGPIGVRDLTCVRWIVDGTGQTRSTPA